MEVYILFAKLFRKRKKPTFLGCGNDNLTTFFWTIKKFLETVFFIFIKKIVLPNLHIFEWALGGPFMTTLNEMAAISNSANLNLATLYNRGCREIFFFEYSSQNGVKMRGSAPNHSPGVKLQKNKPIFRKLVFHAFDWVSEVRRRILLSRWKS